MAYVTCFLQTSHILQVTYVTCEKLESRSPTHDICHKFPTNFSHLSYDICHKCKARNEYISGLLMSHVRSWNPEVTHVTHVRSPAQKKPHMTYVICTAVMPETYKFPALLEVRKFSLSLYMYMYPHT